MSTLILPRSHDILTAQKESVHDLTCHTLLSGLLILELKMLKPRDPIMTCPGSGTKEHRFQARISLCYFLSH